MRGFENKKHEGGELMCEYGFPLRKEKWVLPLASNQEDASGTVLGDRYNAQSETGYLWDFQ